MSTRKLLAALTVLSMTAVTACGEDEGGTSTTEDAGLGDDDSADDDVGSDDDADDDVTGDDDVTADDDVTGDDDVTADDDVTGDDDVTADDDVTGDDDLASDDDADDDVTDDDDVVGADDGGVDSGADDEVPTIDSGADDGADGSDDGGTDDAGPDEVPTEVTGTLLTSILSGEFALLPDGTAGAGVVQLLRREDGTTVVQLQVTGLDPDTEYPAHVHAMPCDVGAADGHYKLDPSVTEALEENEIWPTFTTDENGTGLAEVEVEHTARGDAQALVIHDPSSGNKLLCADLNADGDEEDVSFSGEFAPFALATDVDETAAGTATLSRGPAGTVITVSVSGLDPAATYSSHVHALPCGVSDAGGHYLLDPAAATGETNELWPPIEVSAEGVLESTLEVEHIARADAQSVVIHRDGSKVLCADLGREWPSRLTQGEATVLPGAEDQGVGDLTAEASMTRYLDGTTMVTLSAQGLAPSTEYGSHVHNLPCSNADGGSHYKLDPSVTDALEENEMWLPLTTDADGSGDADLLVGHTPRPEAQSVVIHGADGVRLACIDLE
jgi:Cu-Zn family superoxide dismutase